MHTNSFASLSSTLKQVQVIDDCNEDKGSLRLEQDCLSLPQDPEKVNGHRTCAFQSITGLNMNTNCFVDPLFAPTDIDVFLTHKMI